MAAAATVASAATAEATAEHISCIVMLTVSLTTSGKCAVLCQHNTLKQVFVHFQKSMC